ncbi:MAG: hypothetical protein ACI9QD_000483 [Thermoproteota archaeon]|jgi:hypothetical protein
MQETIQVITEKVPLARKEKVSSLLKRCIRESKDTSKSTYAIHENILFKIDTFFIELSKVLNDIPKAQRIPLGVETLRIVLEELGVDIIKEEAFILYHLRDLGKFKIRDTKLKQELKIAYNQYKEFTVEESDMPHTIKDLMRMGVIEYRKGLLAISKNLVIRYKS